MSSKMLGVISLMSGVFSLAVQGYTMVKHFKTNPELLALICLSFTLNLLFAYFTSCTLDRLKIRVIELELQNKAQIKEQHRIMKHLLNKASRKNLLQRSRLKQNL